MPLQHRCRSRRSTRVRMRVHCVVGGLMFELCSSHAHHRLDARRATRLGPVRATVACTGASFQRRSSAPRLPSLRLAFYPFAYHVFGARSSCRTHRAKDRLRSPPWCRRLFFFAACRAVQYGGSANTSPSSRAHLLYSPGIGPNRFGEKRLTAVRPYRRWQ